MEHSALPAAERVDLCRMSEPPTIIRLVLHRDERMRRYGREYPVPPHVGDLLTLDHFKRLVTITAVHEDGMVSRRVDTPAPDDGPLR